MYPAHIESLVCSNKVSYVDTPTLVDLTFTFKLEHRRVCIVSMLSGYFLPIPKEKQKVVWQTTKVNTNTSIGHE